MRIAVDLTFDEQGAVSLLQWLARWNERIFRSRPELPLLYDAGIVYRRETVEVWSDAVGVLTQGHEDCDALAAYRAGELRAHGWRAMRPGDGGYPLARVLQPRSIDADVILQTRVKPGTIGTYHCVVRYVLHGAPPNRLPATFTDDPSARLGMRGTIDPLILTRWKASGVSPAFDPA